MRIFFLFGIVLYLANMLVIGNHIMNIICVLFLFLFIFFILKRANDFAAISSYFLFSYVVTAIICCVAEYGGYFTEIQKISYLTGATAKNSILVFFTLYFAVISFYWISNDRKIAFIHFQKEILGIETLFITIFYFGIVFVLFGFFLKYGHPNNYGVDRFVYWSDIAPSWGRGLKYFAEICMFYWGRNYALTQKKRYIFYFFIGLCSFYAVGDKFTSFINAFFLFVIPIFILSQKKILSILLSPKFLICFLAAIVILFSFVYFSYFYISGSGEQSIKLINIRLLLQGQMWWGVDLISSLSPKSLDTILHHFLGFNETQETSGIYYLMKLVAPPSVFQSMVEGGVTFTMAYPVNNLYFFGYLSIFSVAISGVLMGVLLGLIVKVIKTGSTILFPIAAIMYFSIIQVFLMACNFYFVSVRFLLSLFLVIFMLLLSRYFKKLTF